MTWNHLLFNRNIQNCGWLQNPALKGCVKLCHGISHISTGGFIHRIPLSKNNNNMIPVWCQGGSTPPILLGYTIGGSIWYCQFLSRHPAAHWASLEVKRSGSRTSFPDPEKPSTGSQNGENQMIIRYIAPGDCTNYPRAISPNCWPNRFHATFLWAHMSTHNITNAQMDVHINFTLQISWSSSTFFFKTRKLITRISPGFF